MGENAPHIDPPIDPLDMDNEGYLVDPARWSEKIAEALAEKEGITLTDEHWKVIQYMRGYWEEHQVSPGARGVTKFMTETMGADRNRLFELFPYGYPGQACKIAGMKRPRAWSTG